jgi:hypothetical protein
MYINLLCQAGITKPSGGRHPWPLIVFSRLLSSLVWAQLTLPALTSGIRPLLPQYGCPIHSVCAHSLARIRNMYKINFANNSIEKQWKSRARIQNRSKEAEKISFQRSGSTAGLPTGILKRCWQTLSCTQFQNYMTTVSPVLCTHY